MVILVILIFALIFAVSYAPSLYHHVVYKYAERNFDRLKEPMQKLHAENVIIVTRKVGQGVSQNSDIRFAKALENQDVAMRSINILMDEW